MSIIRALALFLFLFLLFILLFLHWHCRSVGYEAGKRDGRGCVYVRVPMLAEERGESTPTGPKPLARIRA
jgi:hypothetical protein